MQTWTRGSCELRAEQLARQWAPMVPSWPLPELLARVAQSPYEADDGRGAEGGIKCDGVTQRLRTVDWYGASVPLNCFERSVWGGAAAAKHGVPFKVLSGRLSSGELHTVDALMLDGAWHLVDLTSRVRNSWWDDWGKTAFRVIHTGGKIVLSAYGAGGLADTIERFEEDLGLLDKPAGPQQSTQTPQRKPDERKPATDEKRRAPEEKRERVYLVSTERDAPSTDAWLRRLDNEALQRREA